MTSPGKSFWDAISNEALLDRFAQDVKESRKLKNVSESRKAQFRLQETRKELMFRLDAFNREQNAKKANEVDV